MASKDDHEDGHSNSRRLLDEIEKFAPQGRKQREDRAAFLRAIGVGTPEHAAGVYPALSPIVRAVHFDRKTRKPRDSESVDRLAFDLLRNLANAGQAIRQRRIQEQREALVRKKVWTRSRLERFRGEQRASARRDPNGRVRFFDDRRLTDDQGRGFIVPGAFSRASISAAPSGSGLRPDGAEHREILMGYLVGALKIPVARAARALSELCRLFFGRREDAESVRRWYFRRR